MHNMSYFDADDLQQQKTHLSA